MQSLNVLSIRTHYADSNVENIRAIEVGRETLEQWYLATETPIVVNEEFVVDVSGGYEIFGDSWKSYVTAIPASWLYKIYQKHREGLFSANVREYLGSRKSDSNINHGIKETAEKQPKNFWVFNNGITALVNSYKIQGNIINFSGISIVNGAQTTGAIGSLENEPSSSVYVSARFITCNNSDIVQDIVRYNNSQNKVAPADFRSTDAIQERLRKEFDKYKGGITYLGGRRGGSADSIQRRRRNNHIPSDTIAQALTAFHGYPVLAIQNKSEIWESDSNYSRVFNGNTYARHMVFVFSLHRAITEEKNRLQSLTNRTEAEEENLAFLRATGAFYMLTAAIGSTIETLLNRNVPDRFNLRFRDESDLNTATDYWRPIVSIVLPAHSELKRVLVERLTGQEDTRKALSDVSKSIQMLAVALKNVYADFAKHVEL